MRTIRTKSPSCGLSGCQINLIYGQLTTVYIKAIIRSKFANSGGSAAAIFIDHLLIFFLLSRCFLTLLTIKNCPKNNTCFRESVIWKQSLIRQEIKDIFLANFLKDCKQCRFFTLQFFNFLIIGTIFWLIFQITNHRF